MENFNFFTALARVAVLFFGFGFIDAQGFAAVLWSDPGTTLIHDSGPGRDILKGEVKRDDTSADTLYFKFHVSPLSDTTTEEYFAGFELFEGDAERLAVGNALEAYAYSAFFNVRESGGTNPATTYVDLRSVSLDPARAATAANYEMPHRGIERTIVFKVQYVPGGDDLVTVWMNPDLTAGATEINQPEALTTRFNANGCFDEIRLRHGGGGEGWVFSDLAIATSFSDFVDTSGTMPRAPANTPAFGLERINFQSWLREPGMPRSTICFLAQTADGYLWLASEDQLSRFDGARFVLFDSAAFGGGTIKALCADSEGALWIGKQEGAVVRYAGGRFESRTHKDQLPANSITALAATSDGTLWIGTTNGLWQRRDGKLQALPDAQALDGHYVKTLFADRAGTLWIGAEGAGVFRYQKETLSAVTSSQADELLRDPECITVDPQGNLWVGTGEDFVLCQEEAGWRRYRIPHPSKTPAPRALACEADGTIWGSSQGKGLFQIKQGKLAALNAANGLADNQVITMLVDRDGNFWIGGGAGLHLLKRQQAFVLGQAEGLGPGGVGSLVEVAPGVIWGVQPGRGLLSWERDSFRRLTAAGLTPTDPALGALLVTKDGACWVACEKGLLLFRDPQAAADESRLFELPNGGITALAESPMGGIWAGTRQGELWQLQRGCWRLETQLSPARPISALASEPDGSVWVGTDGGGLLLVNRIIRAQYDRKRGLLSDVVRALHRDSSGTLWVGTEGGGLTRLTSEATVNFTTTAGLPDNDVYGILEAENGNLWLNDGAGLNCIAKPSASASAVEVRGVFALASGQGNASAADPPGSRLFPRPCNGRDGHLWFPARCGIFVAEPFGLTPPANAPIVILEEVLVNGIPNLAFKPLAPAGGAPSLEHLRIGPGNHRLEVHFTCPQFTAPEKLRFRYRMVGLEPDWLEAGASRVAQYNYLPPGDYEFRVTMAGVEGPGTQAALALSVAPHFWQRAWVISSGSLGLLAAMGGVVRFAENRRMKRRMRRLEEENALERERTRIAQDLHDEMGAKLCRISFLSEHAGRLDPASGEMKKQVSAIARDSRELLHSLDEIVWVVNPKNDTLEHLASYLGQYAQYYFQGTGVACELEIAQDLPDAPISSQARHHLFLAVHEALTNALKHSGATCIKLALSCESATLKIQVHDNGCGLDSCVSPGNNSATKAAGSGNGMLNMRQRLAAVGGQCDYRSAPGQGTTIAFILPLESSRFLKPQL